MGGLLSRRGLMYGAAALLAAPGAARAFLMGNGQPPPSPPLGGLTLRLMAGVQVYSDNGITPAVNNDPIQLWKDQSGNGRDAAQSTLANRPIWNATDGLVECAVGGGANNNLELLVDSLNLNTQAGSLVFISRQQNIRQVLHNGANQTVHLMAVQTASFEAAFSSTVREMSMIGGATASKFVPTSLSLLAVAGGAGSGNIVTNGTSDTTAAFSAFTTTGLDLFADPSNGFPAWGGYKEILAYDHQLSGAEISQLQTYAQSLGAVFTSNDVLCFDGDSITVGFGTNNNRGWVRQAFANPNALQYNTSEGGITMATLASTAASVVDPLIKPGGNNILVMSAGSNDIRAGTSASSLFSTLQSYCAARYASGWNKIVAMTLMPRTDNSGGEETQRLAYNALVRANSGPVVDGVADVGGDAIMGQSANASNPTYFSQLGGIGVHPTEVGAAIMAPYFTALINPWL